MDLSKIITITGKPGLSRIVAQGRQGLIVESLTDGKRSAVPATVRVSTLQEISIFTTGDDVPLADVLKKLYALENGGASIDPHEDPEKLFAKLGEVLPEHDRSRIYPSDLRKLFTWYGLLLKAGEFSKPDPEQPEEKKEESHAKPAPKEQAPAKPLVDVAARKATAPKPAAPAKAKSTTMRKSAQRGS